MRYCLKGLAVALTITAFFTLGCEAEREDDSIIDLAQEGTDCGEPLQIWVNSLSGGTVTCDGYAWTFSESAWIRGFCSEVHGFWFTIGLSGPAALTATVYQPPEADGGRPDGGESAPSLFPLDFDLPSGQSVRADYVEVLGGGTVVVTVP